jgi:hypothetical protein
MSASQAETAEELALEGNTGQCQRCCCSRREWQGGHVVKGERGGHGSCNTPSEVTKLGLDVPEKGVRAPASQFHDDGVGYPVQLEGCSTGCPESVGANSVGGEVGVGAAGT